MEIDKAIRESDDSRLKIKYKNAVHVIQRALALYPIEEVAFSFNGGKDSTVLLHLLRAGYFLHKINSNSTRVDHNDGKASFPIRTIYFESPSAFPEINSFTYETAAAYGLKLDIIRLDFKSGLEGLLKENPIRSIFLGVRVGDPAAVGQEQFSPSSPGWPPFMRVNPILDWSYRDIWAFLLTSKVPYCSLYDQGYTSIGSIHDTVPNALLSIPNSSNSEKKFRPAYLLRDGRMERAGRVKKFPASDGGQLTSISNGLQNENLLTSRLFTASVIVVGDEVLFGAIEDCLGSSLCKKLHSIGWTVSQLSVTRNDIVSVAEEVERWKSSNDMVFILGGVGPLQSDVTVAGVAKSFGVRLAVDEEYEKYLRQFFGEKYTGDRNEMAQLPEGITELLHNDQLPMPLIKCQNVIILTATNVAELDQQWDCLTQLSKSSGLLGMSEPFFTKCVATSLFDIEVAQPLSKVCLEFPDIHIGCRRKSRKGPLIISFTGKHEKRLEAVAAALYDELQLGKLSQLD